MMFTNNLHSEVVKEKKYKVCDVNSLMASAADLWALKSSMQFNSEFKSTQWERFRTMLKVTDIMGIVLYDKGFFSVLKSKRNLIA